MTPDADTPYAAGAPLDGRSVVITRTFAQARSLAEPLEALGAEVLAMPVLEIVDPPDLQPLDDAIAALPSYDWLVLTSTNAVDRFFARLIFVDRTAEALSHVNIAVVGRATAARLRERGVEPDLVPADFRAEGLVDAFAEMGVGTVASCRVLIPRALEAREVLPNALREMGCEVDVVELYRTAPAEPDPAVIARLRAGTVDAVTFTSGAIVCRFLEALVGAGLDSREVMARVAVASIGPVTTDALRDAGYEADIDAPEATMTSLADAIGAFFSAK